MDFVQRLWDLLKKKPKPPHLSKEKKQKSCLESSGELLHVDQVLYQNSYPL